MNLEQMFGAAKWLCAGNYSSPNPEARQENDVPNFPILRSSFEVTAVKKATLRVVGLGYFHAYINGKKVTEDLFLPLNTDYEPRKDYPVDEVLTGHRLYVPEFDVTELIASGRNTLAVHFGGGWYTYKYGPFGDPKVIYRLILETESGIREIVSSENDRIGDSVVKISFAFKDEHQIVIGNPLKLSPDFPPLHTVHAAFTAHGVSSEMNFNSFKHNLHTSLQH